MMQCYEPDEAAKTCESIASYRRNPDGSYTNTALFAFMNSPLGTIEIDTLVRIKSGAVCGAIRAGDVARTKVSLSGEPAPVENADKIRSALATGWEALIDKEMCTRYMHVGTSMFALVSMGEKRLSASDQEVKWIKANDGWSVAYNDTETNEADEIIVQLHEISDGPAFEKEIAPASFKGAAEAFRAGMLESMRKGGSTIKDSDIVTKTEIVVLNGHRVMKSTALIPGTLRSYNFAGALQERAIMVACLSKTNLNFDPASGACGRRVKQVFGSAQ